MFYCDPFPKDQEVKNMPLLSVIIPCYNVQEYILKCLDSVYSQGLAPDAYEVLLIDDGSTDHAVEIATGYLQDKSNGKIIRQQNKGLGGARNTGIVNANGTYLLFLDADDWLLPNALKEILTIAENDRLDLLEFAAQGVNSAGKILYHYRNSSEVFSSGIDYYKKVRYMNSACNKLYRRLFLVEHQILFLEKIFIEDFEFNTRCLAKAKKLKATDTLVSQFLQSENSITRNSDPSNRQKMIADIMQVLKITDHHYKSKSANNESGFYLERLNFLVASLFIQLIKNKASYHEILHLKSELVEKGLYYIDYKIFDFKKDILRMVLLKNLRLFKLIQLFY